jgi:hypothetical protein
VGLPNSNPHGDKKRTTANKPRFSWKTGDSTSLCIFPPYPDYSQTLLPSHEKTVTGGGDGRENQQR